MSFEGLAEGCLWEHRCYSTRRGQEEDINIHPRNPDVTSTAIER